MKEFFPEIPYIKYEGKTSTNPLAFRFYNPDEMIAGKPMREHLKFAVAYWHTMCAGGTDMFGVDTHDKTFGSADPMEIMPAAFLTSFCALMSAISVAKIGNRIYRKRQGKI